MIEFALYTAVGVVCMALLVRSAIRNKRISIITIADVVFIFIFIFLWPVAMMFWLWRAISGKVLFSVDDD